MSKLINSNLRNNNYSLPKDKNKSGIHYYLLAVVAGILIVIFSILGLRIFIWFVIATIAFLKEYWFFVIVGIIGLLLLKKMLSKKQLVVVPPRYEYDY